MTSNPAPWRAGTTEELARPTSRARAVARLVTPAGNRTVGLSLDLEGGRLPLIRATAEVLVRNRDEARNLMDPNVMARTVLEAGYRWDDGTVDLQPVGKLQPVQRLVTRRAGSWRMVVTLEGAERYLTDGVLPVEVNMGNRDNRFSGQQRCTQLIRRYASPTYQNSPEDDPIVGELDNSAYFNDSDDILIPLGASPAVGITYIADRIGGGFYHDGFSWVFNRRKVELNTTDPLVLGAAGDDVTAYQLAETRTVTNYHVMARNRSTLSSAPPDIYGSAELDAATMARRGRVMRGEVLSYPTYTGTVDWLARRRLDAAVPRGRFVGLTGRSRWWLRPGHTVRVPGDGDFLVAAVRHDTLTGRMTVDLES